MSVLFRAQKYLTLAQLVPAWARELAENETDVGQVERHLGHFLLEDIVNGRLDNTGPPIDGQQLGLRLITLENQAGFLEGHQVRELIADGRLPIEISRRILVFKEAVRDFARRRDLPLPSWWVDVTEGGQVKAIFQTGQHCTFPIQGGFLGRMNLFSGSNRQRDEESRQRRTDQIWKFSKNQIRARDWINFAEIAEWCSELGRSVVPDEHARASAYEKLQRDLLEGDFEENGRSRVLYRHAWTVKARMTREFLQSMIDIYTPTTIRTEYLDHCWLPRKLFQRWLAKHEMPTQPQRFEPKVETLSEHPSSWQADSPVLKPAPDREIRAAIKATYDAADVAGRKPPNIRELAAAVLPRLEEKGYSASGRLIQKIGEDQEFKRRRRQPGKTISSEQRPRQN